jgi:predicted permease
MTAIARELRPAWRALAARPGHSLLVIGVLAAGLACTVFLFVLIDAMLLRPLPFPAPQDLMLAGLRADTSLGDVDPVSDRDLLAIREHVAGVADTAGVARSTINLSDLDRPERYNGAHASINLFRVLGVAPMLGRDFIDADGVPGAPPVAMLSYDLWQSRYGGDPRIVGHTIRIDAQAATVIGVMPRDFSFPRREELWVASPLSLTGTSDHYSYWVVLRRHADAQPAAVAAALEAWFAEAARAQPAIFRGAEPRVEPLARMTMDPATRSLFGLLACAALIVLAISCANAANLMLMRAMDERRNLALHVALGATRSRLVTRVLMQSVLLGGVAAGTALLLATVAANWQDGAMHQSEFALRWVHLSIGPTVIALALVTGIAAASIASVLPALHIGDATAAGLAEDSRNVAGHSSRWSRWLLFGQVAMSSALLVCVGALVRSVEGMQRVDLGIDRAHLVTARVLLSPKIYSTVDDQLKMFDRIGEHLRADAGVVDASLGTALPGTYYNDIVGIVPADAHDAGDVLPQIGYAGVDDHFLAAWGVKLDAGRFFDAHDTADGARVAVVDRRFVERFGDGKPILGRSFRIDPRESTNAPVRIVGVVGPVTLEPPGAAPLPTMLVPFRQAPFKIASIAVRTRGDANAFIPRLHELMREVDADTPLYWVRDYAAVLGDMSFDERLVTERFALFGVIALGLAAASLYGVMAFTVVRRTREIGVRRALGAPAWRVLSDLFARLGVQLSLGLGVGLGVGVALSRLVSQSLPSIAASSMLDLGAVAVVLTLVATLAATIPAMRALHVDPMVALRSE